MHIEQTQWTAANGWSARPTERLSGPAQLLLVFGAREALASPALDQLRETYPGALVVGCSTAGEIFDVHVTDGTVVATAVRFDKTKLEIGHVRLAEVGDSLDAGRKLGRSLSPTNLRHVFVLSDGLKVNGSDLVKGLAEVLPPGVAVTGGLSGDGTRFDRTSVFNADKPEGGLVSALGFYGDSLQVGYASLGGWDPFGPERLVTRAKGNVVYELDGQSALALYKRFLGPHAAGLPASGLHFPLAMRRDGNDAPVVRGILAIDEAAQSIAFGADIPDGSYVRLMKANFERLIDGASGAAKAAHEAGAAEPELAVLISCVARKLVLQQRIEEEVESVREVLGARVPMTGFYSYGEISPFTPSGRCELHNQTMTITTFAER